jgi:protocatechuate 3,4-dioxygenase beta subunit
MQQVTIPAPGDADPITFEVMGEFFTMTPDAATTYRNAVGEWRAMVSGDVVDEDGEPARGVYTSFALDDVDVPAWITAGVR